MDVVESRYGKLIASRNDIYVGRGLFEYGEFSEGEVEFFRKVISKTSVVVDVGANIGAHTLVFSRLAKHVTAFEPHPMLYAAACGMLALNELDNVTVINAGCAAREGVMTYPEFAMGIPNNFGAGNLVRYEGKRAVKIMKMEIPCDFMKVDVEGMELEVLKGATAMIREKKPVLYVEADRKEKFEALTDYIRQLGYYPYWHTPPLYNPDNFLGKKRDIWGDVYSINMICSPVQLPNFTPVKEFLKFEHKVFSDQVAEMA